MPVEDTSDALAKVDEKKSLLKKIPDHPNAKYAIWWLSVFALTAAAAGSLYRISKI